MHIGEPIEIVEVELSEIDAPPTEQPSEVQEDTREEVPAEVGAC